MSGIRRNIKKWELWNLTSMELPQSQYSVFPGFLKDLNLKRLSEVQIRLTLSRDWKRNDVRHFRALCSVSKYAAMPFLPD